MTLMVATNTMSVTLGLSCVYSLQGAEPGGGGGEARVLAAGGARGEGCEAPVLAAGRWVVDTQQRAALDQWPAGGLMIWQLMMCGHKQLLAALVCGLMSRSPSRRQFNAQGKTCSGGASLWPDGPLTLPPAGQCPE